MADGARSEGGARWPATWWRVAGLAVVFASVSALRWWDADLGVGELVSPVVFGLVVAGLATAVVGRQILAEVVERGVEGAAGLYAVLALLVAVAGIGVEGALVLTGTWIGSLAGSAGLWRRRRGEGPA